MYSFPSSAGSLSIETIISDSFFDFEEDDDRFSDYLNGEIPDMPFELDIPSDIDSSAIVSTIKADAYDFNARTHNLDLYLHFDRELSAEEEERVYADDKLYDYIQHEFIPAFIRWFNDTIIITFPAHTGYGYDKPDFYDLRFDGENFYIMLNLTEKYDWKTQNTDYFTTTVRKCKFELADKFELSV